MSMPRVKRKVAEWKVYHPPAEYTAILECGHREPKKYSDDVITAEQKAQIDERGGVVDCYECGREEEEIASLEHRLKEAKERRRPR